MSILANKTLQDNILNRRYFAAFMFFQGLLVAGSMFYTELLPAFLVVAL